MISTIPDQTVRMKALGYLKRFIMGMGVLATLMLILGMMWFAKLSSYAPPALPDSMVLTYTFKRGVIEQVNSPSLSQPLLVPPVTFHDVIDSLDRAAKDQRVKGFVARIEGVDMTPAQVQELRNAVVSFRKSGKFTYAYAEDFGGGGVGMGDYYLASAFEKIWLQPVGGVSIYGVSAEVPFFKTVMEKIGVKAEFHHKGIYKSAPESLTETGMTAPHREMMQTLLADLSEQVVGDIAVNRGLVPAQVQAIINHSPHADQEALKLKLVDKIGYYDEMLNEAEKKLNNGVSETVALRRYASSADKKTEDSARKIALIIGSGEIHSSKNAVEAGIGGKSGFLADKIAEAFADAEKDNAVAAIVFRVDSPGGSPTASETIRHAIVKAQKAGKPVIVSMGGYAASGGYWIATPAHKIVAQPGTITGSIGVFGGKFVLAQLWEKLGVKWDSVSVGDNARMWSVNQGFTEKQKARFDDMLGNIYGSFIARVAEGRKMTPEQVLAVAEGRVWTGKQAKERGLVDELGGLDKAIALAKIAAKAKPEEVMTVQRFPRQKTGMELFVQWATEGMVSVPTLSIRVNPEDMMDAVQNEIRSEENGVLKMQMLENSKLSF